MENDLKGNENFFELTGGSSYGGFEFPEPTANIKSCDETSTNFVVFTFSPNERKSYS